MPAQPAIAFNVAPALAAGRNNDSLTWHDLSVEPAPSAPCKHSWPASTPARSMVMLPSADRHLSNFLRGWRPPVARTSNSRWPSPLGNDKLTRPIACPPCGPGYSLKVQVVGPQHQKSLGCSPELPGQVTSVYRLMKLRAASSIGVAKTPKRGLAQALKWELASRHPSHGSRGKRSTPISALSRLITSPGDTCPEENMLLLLLYGG